MKSSDDLIRRSKDTVGDEYGDLFLQAKYDRSLLAWVHSDQKLP